MDGQAVLLECLKKFPHDPQAQHLLAAMGGCEVPERASNRYIEDEFDAFMVTTLSCA